MSGLFGATFRPNPIVQEFTATGLSPIFQAPPGTISAESDLIGGGGGGGSGRKSTAGTAAGGAAGGSGANRTIEPYMLAELAAMIGVTVPNLYFQFEIGVGGLNNLPANPTTNGPTGFSGGTTRLRIRNLSGSITLIVAQAAGGAAGGGGGTGTAGGPAAPATPGQWLGGAGGTGTATGAGSTPATVNMAPSGGGGGGGQPAVLNAFLGGSAGGSAVATTGALVGTAGPATNAVVPTAPCVPGGGGGGGSSLIDGSCTVAGNGSRGGGGGGGAGGINGGANGAGGRGGDGYGCIIWRNF